MNHLCSDTIKLIKLLKKYDKKDNRKITDSSFFMNLYNQIKSILKKNNFGEIKITKMNHLPNEYLKDNNFTSKHIKDVIFKKLVFSYKITCDNNTIIYFTSKEIKNTNNIPPIILHMCKIIHLLKSLFNRKYSQKIIYFETMEKKEFPKQKMALGPNEVNSGLTFLDFDTNGEIILYRKEELLKVLIHELIHSNLIDEKLITSAVSKQFSNLFCVDYKVLLNEAVTETLANIINLFYIHIYCKFPKERLNDMFKMELLYSDYICNKILNYYSIPSINDIIKNNQMCKVNFPQKTNVLSYYILKNILLKNYMEFGNLLNKCSSNYKINVSCIDKIIILIMKNIKKTSRKTSKNKHNRCNDENKKNDKNNSLRLCLYQLDL
jgi:hypothetical protein